MFTLNCRGRLLTANRPLVMGIINVTPDSFYEGSRTTADAVLRSAERMLHEGADIIDLGAQSSRPGATMLSAEEEMFRMRNVIEALVQNFPEAIVSVDTFYSRVARECVAAGAHIINDISGGNLDEAMLATVGNLRVPYICMHMRGTPQTMSTLNQYDDIAQDLIDYFVTKVDDCRRAGINDVIIDPGFGFSKNSSQNFELLRKMSLLKIVGRPVLAGLSRKATVYKTLGTTPQEALNGTTVVNTLALINGADILRVHDVKEARECITLVSEYQDMRSQYKRAGFTK
jgi:dihydropteroate synthase